MVATAQRVEALEASLAAEKDAGAKKQQEAEERQAFALERLQERLDVERERAVLTVRTEAAEKLEKERAAAVASQAEATAQIRKLYEEIRTLQTKPADGDDKPKGS